MTHQLYDTIGGHLWVDADENEMECLKAQSRYEWRKVDYIQRHLKSGMTFVDVGAHIGYFTMLAARRVDFEYVYGKLSSWAALDAIERSLDQPNAIEKIRDILDQYKNGRT